ncbi:GntR family transcriptional regulator [Oceanibium sediminis]|uniref:GntR family transcriptional regulator n=1 Tax=Oceanibium sediminis TaxID=2026339 RepID=UPI000DD2EAB6|nr:GntR family transcriptional regulator [Oceanibium sediminis]
MARRRSLHDELVTSIREMIIDGELLPGDRVAEGELCEEFQVSRTPLREAFKVLASEGLVELIPNRGCFISAIRVEDVAEVFEVLSHLEELIGRLVVERATDRQIQDIVQLHETMRACHDAGDRTRYFKTNLAIHIALVRLTGNDVLATFCELQMRKIMRARAFANADTLRLNESMQEHEAFMQALLARDAATFGRLLREHNERTAVSVIEQVTNFQDPA